ncbi:MAG TPA: hypothetical protein VFH51_08120, partial [Myxococcota bacterium]|nr:hypothetical protein [Myxococcota bacterium]
RPGEAPQERVLKLEDMIFIGDEVAPGIAFRFLEHLRHLGDPYRTGLLRVLADPQRSQADKLKLAGAAMSSLMSGEVYPEAKVPVSLPLDLQLGEMSTPAQQWPADWMRQSGGGRGKPKDVAKKLELSIRYGDVATLQEIIQDVDWKVVRNAELYQRIFAYHDPIPSDMALFMRSLRRDNYTPKPELAERLLEVLLRNKVTAFGDDFHPNALDLAMKHHASPAQIDKLLAAEFDDPRDPSITLRAPVSHIDFLREAVRRPGMLAVFVKNGAHLEPHAATLMLSYLQGVYQDSDTDCIEPAALGPEFGLLLERGGLPPEAHRAFAVLQKLIVANDPEAFAQVLARAKVPADMAAPMGHVGTSYLADGTTLLHLAAVHARPEILQQLITYGCALDARSEIGMSALDRIAMRLDEVQTHLRRTDLSRGARANFEALARKLESCRTVLLEAGAAPSAKEPTLAGLPAHRALVRVVVTGRGHDGRQKVLAGRPRAQEEGVEAKDAQWTLPGGYLTPDEPTVIGTARSFLQLQTGITGPVLDEVLPESAEPVYDFRHEGVAGKAVFREHFYHVDIGARINKLRLSSGLNWAGVRVVDLETPAVPLQPAYAAVARAADAGRPADARRQLEVLHDGYYLINDAIERNDLDAAKALVAEGARLTATLRPKTLEVCCQANNLAALRWVLEMGPQVTPDVLEAALSAADLGLLEALLEHTDVQSAPYVAALKSALDTSVVSAAKVRSLVAHLQTHPTETLSILNSTLIAAATHGLWPEAENVLAQIVPLAKAHAEAHEDDEEGRKFALLIAEAHGDKVSNTYPERELQDALLKLAAVAREAGHADIATRLTAIGKVQSNFFGGI